VDHVFKSNFGLPEHPQGR